MWLVACSGSSSLGVLGSGTVDSGTTGNAGKDAAAATDSGADASTADATTASPTDSGSPFTTNDAGAVLCGADVCSCNDGEDNDGDGLVDGFDPECTGPYDNDEGSLATGIPGDNKDQFQDCFFDGNSGGGGGDCKIHFSCILDRESQECADAFTGQRTLESEEAKCESLCEPRTPNGCDCFGCCEIYTSATESTFVFLENACEVEIGADGHASIGGDCRSCTPSAICGNECGECELCPGRGLDLPDSCAVDPPDAGAPSDAGAPPVQYQCFDGAGNPQPTCTLDSPCAAGQFCANGCCRPSLI